MVEGMFCLVFVARLAVYTETHHPVTESPRQAFHVMNVVGRCVVHAYSHSVVYTSFAPVMTAAGGNTMCLRPCHLKLLVLGSQRLRLRGKTHLDSAAD